MRPPVADSAVVVTTVFHILTYVNISAPVGPAEKVEACLLRWQPLESAWIHYSHNGVQQWPTFIAENIKISTETTQTMQHTWLPYCAVRSRLSVTAHVFAFVRQKYLKFKFMASVCRRRGWWSAWPASPSAANTSTRMVKQYEVLEQEILLHKQHIYVLHLAGIQS